MPAASAYIAGAPANFELEKFALADDAVRFYTLPLRDASLTVDQKTHEAGVRTTETREGERRKRRETRLRHERSWCSWSERSPSIRLGGCVRRTMIVVKEAWPDVSLLETSETWSQVKQALRSIGAWVEDENRLSTGQVRQLLRNVCICSVLDHEVRCSCLLASKSGACSHIAFAKWLEGDEQLIQAASRVKSSCWVSCVPASCWV